VCREFSRNTGNEHRRSSQPIRRERLWNRHVLPVGISWRRSDGSTRDQLKLIAHRLQSLCYSALKGDHPTPAGLPMLLPDLAAGSSMGNPAGVISFGRAFIACAFAHTGDSCLWSWRSM
jgi:hypothetical protein